MNLAPNSILNPLRFAFRTIRRHKARTALSLLGVVVGVFAVVVVLSLGEGLKQYVVGMVSSFGSDIIQVEIKVPNTGKTSTENAGGIAQGIQITTLTLDDEEKLQRLPNVEATYAGLIAQERASRGSVNKQVLLFGAGSDAPLVDTNLEVESGRFFTEEEDEGLARVAVIGSGLRDSFFGAGDPIGETLLIGGERYRVVGALAPRGTIAFFDFDDIAYIPVRTVQRKVLGIRHVQMISVRMADPAKEEETVALITETLRREHDIDDPDRDDFAVTSTREAQEILGDVVGTIRILLLALTSISLVVGGVGIMNVMYVSVSERTSEIGLRKAVGARSGDILAQFLVEALIITGLGGILGILFGILVSWLISIALTANGIALGLVVSPQSLLLGAVFAISVGLLFGLAPASRAARLSPMEAIRKE